MEKCQDNFDSDERDILCMRKIPYAYSFWHDV